MKVLCVTSNPCIDHIVWYREKEEKPSRVFNQLGGKGVNVARMLQGAGVEACSLTITGSNDREIRRLSGREAFRSVLVPTAAPVRTLVMEVKPWEGTVRQAYRAGNHVSPEECAEFQKAYEKLLEERPQWVVISGGTAEGMEAVIPQLIRRAKESGSLVFFDSYGSAFEKGLACGPDYVKPNMDELRQTVGEVRAHGEAEAARKLLAAGAGNVFVTLGDEGSCLVTGDGEFYHPGFPVRTVSALGSGDSFTAFFIYGMINGLNREESFIMANAAGAVNAARVLNGRVTLKSVQKLLKSRCKKEYGTTGSP